MKLNEPDFQKSRPQDGFECCRRGTEPFSVAALSEGESHMTVVIHCLSQFLPAILVPHPLFICMWDQQHYFAAQNNVVKDNTEKADLFFL